MIDLTEFSLNFPQKPVDEIPRDGQVTNIIKNFNDTCQIQLVTGDSQTGKTNFLGSV
jgi:hypothetical protein